MKKHRGHPGLLLASCLFLSVAVGWICADTLFGASLFGSLTGQACPAVSVTIPDLTDQPFSEERLDGSNLFDLSVTYVYSKEPARQVLDQLPAPGTRRKVVPGLRPAELHVTVSMGQPVHAVPEVIGLSRVEAEKALRDAGLNPVVRTVRERNGTEPIREEAAGRVRRSDPPVGERLEEGASVVLYVTPDTAQASARCPDLTGLDLAVVPEVLKRAGLVMGEVTFFSAADPPPGTVWGQSIAPGSLLPSGTAVGLSVSVPVAETDDGKAVVPPSRTSPVFP